MAGRGADSPTVFVWHSRAPDDQWDALAERRLVAARVVRHILVMSKYATLRDWLRQSGHAQVPVSFDQLNDLVPGGLPPSAYNHGAWWNNESDPGSTHSQSRLGVDGRWLPRREG